MLGRLPGRLAERVFGAGGVVWSPPSHRLWNGHRLQRRRHVGDYFLCLALFGAVCLWPAESAAQSLPTATGAPNKTDVLSTNAERGQIEAYCRNLAMSTGPGGTCDRVSLISFTSKGSQRASWDANYTFTDNSLGRVTGVASSVTGENSYSCMSIAFNEPWPEGTDVAFIWTVGRSSAGTNQASGMRVWANARNETPVFVDVEDLSLLRASNGFSSPQGVSWVDAHSRLSDLRWCYFGAQTNRPNDSSRGVLHSVIFNSNGVQRQTRTLTQRDDSDEIAAYCSNMLVGSATQCKQIERIIFSARGGQSPAWLPNTIFAPILSAFAPASPRTGVGRYSCMQLNFSPPFPAGTVPSFWWSAGKAEQSGTSKMKAWVNPPANHVPDFDQSGVPTIVQNSSGFTGWVRHREDFGAQIDAIKWCYFGGDVNNFNNLSRGRVDNLGFSPPVAIDDDQQIDRYCSSLALSPQGCKRIDRIVFSGTLGADNAVWNSARAGGAVSGDGLSVASSMVGGRGYSCLSMHFDPPIPSGWDIRFAWSFGFGNMKVWFDPPADHVPDFASNSRSAAYGGRGFSPWYYHTTTDFARPVSEVKWCYLGRDDTPEDEDRGRLDRLEFGTDRDVLTQRPALAEYCDALNMPPNRCQELRQIVFTRNGAGEHVWDPGHAEGSVVADSRSLASPPVAAGEYSCMSMHFDPPIPQGSDIRFDWSLGKGGSGSAEMGLWLSPPIDHDPLGTAVIGSFIRQPGSGFTLWSEYILQSIAAPVPELKWCYFGDNPTPGDQDRGRIDRLEYGLATEELSDRDRLDQYCTALNMPAWNCARLSAIVFARSGIGEHVWDSNYAATVFAGDRRSVASPVIADGDYSCMSLLFSPGIGSGSDISLIWSVGRGAGSGPTQLELWLNPPPAQLPMATADGRFIRQSGSGFTPWANYSATSGDERIEEVKWCYFGRNAEAGERDRAQLLRFGFSTERELLSELAEIAEYCAALDMSLAHCERLSSIVFSRSDEGEPLWTRPAVQFDEMVLDDMEFGSYRLVAESPALASSPVGADDYSCMSLHFRTPLPPGTRAAHLFEIRQQRGALINSRLAVYVAPPEDHVPSVEDTLGLQENSPFWARYLYGAIPAMRIGVIDVAGQLSRSQRESLPVTELKWCYFGANDGANPGPDDIVVMDAMRLIFTTDTVEITDRQRLDGYCEALDMLPYSCFALSAIEFTASLGQEPLWPIDRSAAAPEGGDASVRSLPIGADQYSCMSMRFDPSLLAPLDVAFLWSLGRGDGVGTTQLQLWLSPPADHVPAALDEGHLIRQPAIGTVDWSTYSATVEQPRLGEIKWCYFGANASPGDQDRGRIDRLSLAVTNAEISDRGTIESYCETLDMSVRDCRRVARIAFTRNRPGMLIWDDQHSLSPIGRANNLSVASPPTAAGDYSCMSFHLHPPLLPGNQIGFDFSMGEGGSSEASAMGFFVAPGIDHVPEPTALSLTDFDGDFDPWRSQTLNTVSQRSTELKWCYFGINADPGERDAGRIDDLSFRLSREEFTDRNLLDDYCLALDLPPQHCARLSGILQETSAPYDGLSWTTDHRTVAPLAAGNGVALALRADDFYQASCLALRFDPPWPPLTALSFWWDLSHSGDEVRPSGAQVLLNHGRGDAFEFDAAGAVLGDLRSRTYAGQGFAGWSLHVWSAFPEPISELKWCHYNNNLTRSLLRLDQLEFTTDSHVVIDEPEQLGSYCAALDASAAICRRLSRISFVAVGADGNALWSAEHAASSPDGGGVSVASRLSGRTAVSCMGLHFEPPWPPYTDLSFWWDLGRSAGGDEPVAVRVLLNRGPVAGFDLEYPGSAADGARSRSHLGSGFAGWSQHRWIDFPEPLSDLRWCHYEEPGTEVPRVESIARIDRLVITTESRMIVSARERVDEYCAALDALPWICERLSHISFAATGGEENLLWTADRAEGSPEGGSFSVASPPVGVGDYSCMSLHFNPPLAAESNIEFDWTVSGLGRLQLWAPPPAIHVPAVDSAVRFIVADSSGVATWYPHSFSTAAEPLGELKWCYFGGGSEPGAEDIGSVDRLRIGPYSEVLSDGDRLTEYCTILSADAPDCPFLSRIEFTATAGDDAVWPLLTMGSSVDIGSPPVAAGEEACMRWEFIDSRLEGVNALRIDLSWLFLGGAAAARLSFQYGEEGQSGRLVAELHRGVNSDIFWIPYSPGAANYWLRFCYQPGERGSTAAGDAMIGELALWRFRPDFSITEPTDVNRQRDFAEYRRYQLQLAARLQALSPAGVDRAWRIGGSSVPRLPVRSRSDLVYTQSGQEQPQPLAVELLTILGNATHDTVLWLPQSRRVREQYFELLTPNGLLLSSTSITVPAIRADEDAGLNIFCEALLPSQNGSHCENLVLPGDGTGDWQISTSSVSVSYIAPSTAVDGSCLRLLVGESAESGWVRVGFVWRGPTDSTARLVFRAEDQAPPSRRVAPSAGAPAEVILMLPLRPDGQLLSWCIEGTETRSNPDVWGLFQPLSVEHIVSEEISDRGRLERYCLALDLSPQSCARLSAVVQENGQSFGDWDPTHSTVAPSAGGNNISLASRSDGRAGPSCLALQFDPPWPPYTNLSFWWDLGHSGGGDAPAGVQVLLNHGPGDAFEFAAPGYPRSGIRTRIAAERGFAGWYWHRWVAFPEPIAELKWCHYEEPGSGIARPDSIARVDRLELIPQREVVIADRERIGAYCSALDLPEWGCARIGQILFSAAADSAVVWDAEHAASSPEGGGISVALRSAGSSEVSCMALQFAPPWPPYTDLSFWWDLGHSAEVDAPAVAQVLLNHGPGNAFEFAVSGELLVSPRSRRFESPGFAGWVPHRWADFAEPLSELKWCYYEKPGSGVPRPESIVRIDRLQLTTKTRVVVTAPERLAEYCDALDAPQWVCGRLSRIVLAATGDESSLAWSVDRAVGSPDGGVDSLVSAPVGAGDYSCMSLHFSPPFAAESAIAFDWAVDGGGRLQLWAPPPVDHLPAVAATVPFIADEGSGVATWSSHSFSVSGEALGELRWCYFGASLTSGTSSIGRVDRLRVDSNINVLDDRERLAEYCRILPFADEDCRHLSRIVFSLADVVDAVWPVVVSSTPQLAVSVVSPVAAAGQEACMRWEFTDGVLTGVNALRIDLDWTFLGLAADAGLSVVHGGAAHSPRVLAEASSGSSRRFLWAPHVPTAPNYWLRFCYRPGEQNSGRMGDAMLTRLAIQRLRPNIEPAQLTVASRISGDVGYRRYNYSIRSEFQLLAPTASIRSWSTSEDVILRLLRVRSRHDLAYTGAEPASLQPLSLSLLVFVGVSGVSGQMWVPQSRRVREQYFELWTRNGLLLSRSSLTVPAVAADDSDALLNRFCAELLAVGDTASCEHLVLPGNGTGNWRLSTSSVSVPYIAPPAAVDGSCLRLLVGESAESGWVRVGFVWRGPDDSTARLVFHVGDEPSPSRRVAPPAGAPAETAVILPLSPEGQLLNWCIEGTPAASGPDVWGLFQPFSVEHIVSEEINDRDRLERYCLALDLSPQSCARLSAVVQENGQSFGEAVWDPTHSTVAPSAGGNNISLASRSDGRAGPSCLALRFDPPWPPYTALSFWWDLGHSGGGDTPAGVQVLLNHGTGDAFEFDASGDPRSGIRTRISAERGFAGWSRHRWISFPEPIAELKWCHYEEPGTGIPRPDSIARVDRLELVPQREVVIADRERIGAYCSALELPERGCARIEQILFSAAADSTVVWDAEHAVSSPEGGGISVASRSAGGSEVSCMALQFAPPWPPYTDLSFWWDLGHSAEVDAPAAVQVLLNHGPGDAFEFAVSGELLVSTRSRHFEGPGFAGWAPHRWTDFAEPLSELKWCYYEKPGTGVPRPDSIVRIDRLQLTPKTRAVVTAPDRLGEYCDALDSPQWVCGRLSRIVFAASGGESSPVWTVERTLGSPDGDADSLVSPLVGAGNYSCMSLYFSPPFVVESAIAFDWAAGEGGRLQLWAPPPTDHVPAVEDTVPFITDEGRDMAIWSSHSFTVDEPLGELRWCYFGVSSTSGTSSVGRLDRLRVDSNIDALDDRERLAEYCRIMPFAAEDCSQLSRIVFSVTEGNDMVWPVVSVSTSQFGVTVVSPAVAAGHEACMRWEFVAGVLPGVHALGIDLDWIFSGLAAAAGLSVVHGGAAYSPRVLAEVDNGSSRRLLWAPQVPTAPNYWLRFCYRPGEQNAGRMGVAALTRLGFWRFRAELSIEPPTVLNRLSGSPELFGYRLPLAVRLQAVSPTGSDRSWGISEAESPQLVVRSRFDFVYTGAESALLRPLAVDLLAVDGVADSEAELWLPQSRRIGREQYFELLTPNGLLLSSRSLTVPAVAADDSDLALNRFCAELLAVGDTDSCERLVLPGNGIGEWRLSTSSASVPYIAPLAAGSGSCLRLQIGEGSETGLMRLSFSWRGPNSAVARLSFHIGDGGLTGRIFAPSLGEPESAAVALPLRPQGHRLSWCVDEATESTAAVGVWGLFRPLSLSLIANDPDIEPVLTVSLLIRLLLFEQERLAVGTPTGMVLPGRYPPSLSPRVGLPDIPAEEVESVWGMLYGLAESGRFDVDGNQRYDERDLRLMLRYLAGLRGDILSSDQVDEARLMELLSP